MKGLALSKKAKTLLIFGVFSLLYASEVPKYLSEKLRSANLTSVSVTMSTSKLSYKAVLAAGNTAGSSVVTIAGTGPSTTTTNLFTGDSVLIGSGGTAHTYSVNDISSSTQIALTSGLFASDISAGNLVIASRSAALSVRFKPASAVANGAFRILVPAAATTNNDGIPDHTGFDFGVATPTVTCPADVGATYDFAAGTASPDAVTLNTVHYHAYTCRYSGAGSVGQDFTGDLNIATISAVINPAPANGHSAGTADQYRVIVQQLSGSDSGDSTVDSTTVSLAAIEAVRVTASVDPILQFSIQGVTASSSICGITTTVDTTATGGNVLPNVPLGTLGISSFTDASQLFTVSTNALNGYAVTALENDQLTKPGSNPCADSGVDGYGAGNGCIPDVTGGSETGTGLNWSSTATKGFGYTLQGGSVPNGFIEAYYSAGTSSCGGTGTYCARKFPDNQNGEPAQRLFFSTTSRDTDTVNVCYRAVISTSQDSGSYQNNVTYTATATF